MSDVQGNRNASDPEAASIELEWVQTAQGIWLRASKPQKITPFLVEEKLWKPLEASNFEFRTLALLESLQLLEYLWSTYSEDSTNHHVLLIGFLLNIKKQQDLPTWTTLTSDPELFASFFRRMLSLGIDNALTTAVRTYVCSFFIMAFQSLDTDLVRKECAPLVSISIWHNLSTEAARERKFNEHNQLRKAWRAASKRYEAADEAQKAKLRFDRAWLNTLVHDFVAKLQTLEIGTLYCS